MCVCVCVCVCVRECVCVRVLESVCYIYVCILHSLESSVRGVRLD